MGMIYEQELNLREIGAVLGVSESRFHSCTVRRWQGLRRLDERVLMDKLALLGCCGITGFFPGNCGRGPFQSCFQGGLPDRAGWHARAVMCKARENIFLRPQYGAMGVLLRLIYHPGIRFADYFLEYRSAQDGVLDWTVHIDKVTDPFVIRDCHLLIDGHTRRKIARYWKWILHFMEDLALSSAACMASQQPVTHRP